MKLTFGFPTTSDPNAWMTLNAFKKDHRHLRQIYQIEIVIVDNSKPGCRISAELEKHVKANHPDVKYVKDQGPPSSCLYKSRVFQHATGDVVVCVDSHVMLDHGCLESVANYFVKNPDSLDLLTGPCMNSADKLVATNQALFEDEGYPLAKDAVIRHGYVCRGGQLGTWVTDERGLDPNGEPFVIRMNGTGFLAMRREAYPGFPDNLWGFGGCEPALFRRVEKAGGKVLCHPACRWIHSFMQSHGRGYEPLAVDKVRNYITSAIATDDLALKSAAIEHFASIHPEWIGPAIVQAEQIVAGTFVPGNQSNSCKQKAINRAAHKPAKVDPNQPIGTIPAAHKPEKPVQKEKPKKPSVYDPYIEVWKKAGGDVGGACPAPLFVKIVHLKPKVDKDGNVRPLKTLEFGCGLSTLGFDRNGTDHTAIEHDEEWIKKTMSLVTRPTTRILQVPIKDNWYDWQPELGELYDVIFIDGPPGSIGRTGCINVVPKILAPGGMIIIDDTHREAEQKISAELASKLEMTAYTMKHGERKYDLLLPAPEPLGEGPGTELVAIFADLKMPTCQQCHNLARKMNEWGPEGCWEKMDYIVEDMLPRARAWWAQSSPWMKGTAWFKSQGSMWEKLTELKAAAKGKITGDADAVLRDSIRVHVAQAIKASKDKQAQKA